MITAEDMAGMQETLEDTFPDEMIVHRLERTTDSSMGTVEEWNPIPSPVPCRFAPMAGGVGSAMAETLIAGRIGTAEGWIFSCPVGSDVLNTDRIVVDDQGFEVALILEPRTWQINMRFVAIRMA